MKVLLATLRFRWHCWWCWYCDECPTQYCLRGDELLEKLNEEACR